MSGTFSRTLMPCACPTLCVRRRGLAAPNVAPNVASNAVAYKGKADVSAASVWARGALSCGTTRPRRR